MRQLARLLCIVLALGATAGCSSTYQPAPNYYENDIHRGYPGPGIADPSAT